MPRVLVRILIVACAWSALLLALSWPLLRAFHARLGLPAPPLSGFVVLGGGILLALAGGAAIGYGIGQLGGRNPARMRPLLAAGAALLWGIFVVATAAPLYASSITEAMTRDGSLLLWQGRGTLAQSARETTARVRRGESRQAAEAAARAAYDKAKPLALRSAAMLPAFLLLGWAILIPPFLGAWECRRASR